MVLLVHRWAWLYTEPKDAPHWLEHAAPEKQINYDWPILKDPKFFKDLMTSSSYREEVHIFSMPGATAV